VTDIIQSIQAIKLDAQVSVDNDDINMITWHDNNPTNITNEQILEKQVELQAEYDALEYARKREAEYPSVQDLVVALYDTEDKLAIETKRAEIKLKYPKP
jgi:hypothetical protein